MEKLPILEDTDINIKKRFLYEKLSSAKEWSNMFFIEEISKAFRFASYSSVKKDIIHLLSTCLNEVICDPKSTENIRKKATRLHNTIKLVVDSRPMNIVIDENITKQSKHILRNDLVQQAYDELTNYPVKSRVAVADQEEHQETTKKRKYLKKADLKDLDYGDKIVKLNEYFGMENILDLTKNGVIPKRFKSVIQDVFSNYNMLLVLKLHDTEHEVIQQISRCQTKEELYRAVDNINPFINTTELPYIKLATQKLCNILFWNILKSEHHEDWYRTNLYGDLFDFIFSVKSNYESKRSECHSHIIKSLRKMGALPPQQKNVRLDFIFSHAAGLNDGFFCEDKPTSNESIKDNKKAKNLREKALVYWSSLLPYKECIKYITAFSCQFNKLKLQVKATKIINGVTVHTNLKEVDIPNDEQGGPSLAEYLSTVISLVRMVLQNFDIIKVMIDVVKKDNLAFLSTSEITGEHFRENSPCDLASSNSTASSITSQWQGYERKLRIMEKIETEVAKLKEEDDKPYVNLSWEDIYLANNSGQ